MILAQIMPEASFSFAPLFLKTVVVTIIIIAFAIVVLRYFIPRLHNLRRDKNSRIQILDCQPLDARKMVYILQIRDKTVAVGVTEQSVTKICDL